jgi:DNA-binding CsgD family transcriptional regulator
MDRLGQSELVSLLQLTRDCYALGASDSFEDFLRNLVTSLSQLISATHVTYNEMNPEKPESHNWVNTPDLATTRADALWQAHMNEHPVVRHVLETGDRHAVRISDFWNLPELHDHSLYSDFYRLYAIEDALCITIPSPAPIVIGAGWHRDLPFTDRELLLADLARPHISQAWQNARLVSGMRRQLKLLVEGLDDAPQAAIFCGPDGHVQFATALARHYLDEYLAAGTSLDHCLPAELLDWVKDQNAQLKATDAPPVRTPLVLIKGNKRLMIRLLSGEGTQFGALLGPNARANLLLLEEEEDPTLNLPALGQPGLSPREREVLSWLAQGKTNREIAAILGSKIGTVRKHLEHVFQKLGVETRTAAAVAFQSLSRKQ